MEVEKEVNKVMAELESGSRSSLYNSLIMLRTTLIKSRAALNQLVQRDAIRLLVQLLEEHQRHVNSTKTVDIVMSILANMCIEEDIREKVICCDGLSVLARVTMSSVQESIQNRGMRALANLALDVKNCEKIFELEVPAFVAKKLMETEDVDCRSTYCRALQLFGQTGKHVKKLVEDTQAIQALAAQLKLDNRKLALKSLRILSELSALRCCPSFTGQILIANILEELITLADDDDSSSASCSLSIILRLSEQEMMRPALGSAGVISLLVKLLKSGRDFVNKVWTLNALCLCTKEAVNRSKIQDAGGLEIFILALREDGSGGQFSVLHDRIISSLVNFLYNDDCFGKLLELGLVRILVEHLKRVAPFVSVDEDLRKEAQALVMMFEPDEALHPNREEVKLGSGSCSEKNGQEGMQIDSGSCFNVKSGQEGTQIDSGSCFSEKSGQEGTQIDSGLCSVGEFSDLMNEQCTEAESDFKSHLLVSQGNEESLKEISGGSEEDTVVNAEMDSDKRMVGVECEETENPDSAGNIELPLPLTTRNTFSINSPTYQAESSWRLEDYTSGVTCKAFSQDQDAYRMTPQHSLVYSMNAGVIQSPYSPLSAATSYYSPSQASPSHSIPLSPLPSLLSSPANSGSYQDSPAWSQYSNHNSPISPSRPRDSTIMSPASLAYQNCFSPLTNDFPASPTVPFGEGHSQSPAPGSQTSIQSQDMFGPYTEKPLDSLASAGASDDIDQLLTQSRAASSSKYRFTIVPLSHQTETNVYSASEDDDDDEMVEEEEREDRASDAVVNISSGAASSDNKDIQQKISLTDDLTSKSNPEKHTSSGNRDLGNASYLSAHTIPAQRRPSFDSQANNFSTVQEICDVKESGDNAHNIFRPVRHLSGGFNTNSASADDGEESLDGSLDDTEAVLKPCLNSANSAYTSKAGKVPAVSDIHRPDANTVTENFQKRIFQRMSSYPGKKKWPVQSPSFRRHMSAAVSHTAINCLSPASSNMQISRLGASPLISDSPYRSPYPESSQTSILSSDGQRVDAENTETSRSDGSSSTLSKEVSSRMSNIAITRDAGSTSSTEIRQNSRPNQNTSDERVKKILRTTEHNILILLARVSLKTNPVHLTAENSIVSCLPGYTGSAPNPLRRSYRIMHRLCSNPHCFKKLVLMQMPAILVKSLVLDENSSFPSELLYRNRQSGNTNDLSSSQGSDLSGSQTSEFGRKLDFEFGCDSYSRMTSKKHQSFADIFQSRASISVESDSARDGFNGADDIYEVGSSRAETRVKIGLELLHTMGAVAMSSFGEGEIQQVLARHSAQDKVACIISMLHLRVGWDHLNCHQFFSKYSLWKKILPCLFIPEAPVAREAIVAAMSLNVRLNNPPRRTQNIPKLPTCPDLTDRKDPHELLQSCSSESPSGFSGAAKKSKRQPGENVMLAGRASENASKESLYESFGYSKNTATSDQALEKATLCSYQNMSDKYDIFFSVQDESGTIHKFGAYRNLLIQKSDIFAAMFSGSYSESSQSEVPLVDVDGDAFEFIIHYLHGCSSCCPVIDSLDVEKIQDQAAVSSRRIKVEDSGIEEMDAQDTLGMLICESYPVGVGLKQEIVKHSCISPAVKLPCQTAVQDKVDTEGNSTTAKEHNLEMKEMQQTSRKLSFDKPHIDNEEENANVVSVKYSREHAHGSNEEEASNVVAVKYSNKLAHGSNEKEDANVVSRKHAHGSNEKEDANVVSLGQNDSGLVLQETASEPAQKNVDLLINKCLCLLAMADRFLLKDLMDYVASFLSHSCLCPTTIEDIFSLACFYQLDSLAFDCIRETLMSCLPCNDAAAIYRVLADNGYRKQVHAFLTCLLNSTQCD